MCLPRELCDCFILFSFEIGKQCLEVLDRLWNESGHEEDISGEEFEQSGENDEDYFDESESSDEFLLYIWFL